MKLSLLLLFYVFLISFLSTNSLYSKVTLKPYLQALDSSGIYLIVECDSPEPVTVEYGKSLDFGQNAKTEFYVEALEKRKKLYLHRIKLTGLEPNAVYYYRATQGDDLFYNASFRSFLPENTPIIFAVTGDNRSNPKKHSEISKAIKKHHPNILVLTGDLCGNGEYNSWKKEFFTDAELELISSVPFYSAIGNHEFPTKLKDAFLEPPKTKSEDRLCYSFDDGPCHFTVLNTEISLKPDSPQWNFVKQDIIASKKKWKIVVTHKPPYSSGAYTNNPGLVKMSEEIFNPGGVTFVFSGHSHFYQRNLVNGINYLILGGGGAPLYDPKPSDMTVKSVKDYNFAIFEASSDKIKFKIYDLHGNILDELEINK